jgi:hypothetical protein
MASLFLTATGHVRAVPGRPPYGAGVRGWHLHLLPLTFCCGLFGTLQVATVTGPVAVFAKQQASRAPRHPSVRILAARVRGTNGHR